MKHSLNCDCSGDDAKGKGLTIGMEESVADMGANSPGSPVGNTEAQCIAWADSLLHGMLVICANRSESSATFQDSCWMTLHSSIM